MRTGYVPTASVWTTVGQVVSTGKMGWRNIEVVETAGASSTLDIRWHDASAGSDYALVSGATMNANESRSLTVSGLEQGDYVQVKVGGTADVTVTEGESGV